MYLSATPMFWFHLGVKLMSGLVSAHSVLLYSALAKLSAKQVSCDGSNSFIHLLFNLVLLLTTTLMFIVNWSCNHQNLFLCSRILQSPLTEIVILPFGFNHSVYIILGIELCLCTISNLDRTFYSIAFQSY